GSANVVAYSLIQGSGGSAAWNGTAGSNGGNNIDVNPNFVSEAAPLGADNIPATADDGLRLPVSSPSVDKGNNDAAGIAGLTTDYVSAARIQGSRVDMGAYEQAGIVIPKINIYWLKDWDPFKPGCLSCPWAFKLSEDIFEEFIWDGPAQLIQKENEAVITGHIVSRNDKKKGFYVYLKLVDEQDWETWSSNKGTYAAYTLEAIQVAKLKHKDWTFWELSKESYLKGTGALSGQLELKTLPGYDRTGFQLGEGANGWDKDLGLSGSFRYQGKLNYKGKKLNTKGIGSINVDALPCEKACVPLIELSNSVAETAQLYMFDGENSTSAFSVFPVPATSQITINLGTTQPGKYTLKFYTAGGQLKKQETVYADKTRLQVPVNDLTPGTYVLQLVSSAGKTESRKLVIR
ncbi:MAG TPA: T9SS type A sorting domain-containing protein, partial [Chitinophagaceae bacterium]|nr:T9SS type A sorting domain-containing protein [Chitinophagaceae bacterium]